VSELASEPSAPNPTEQVEQWLREHLGGRVVSMARQPRWRPVWFADVERDGEVLELCVRGDRLDFPGIFPLEHEMRCQQLLEQHGIPVAGVHGWIDEPRAFVIDRVPGEPDFAGVDEATRDAVVDDYLSILARLHQLDVEPFARAGVARAASPAASGELGMRRYVEGYRASKKRPDPFLEFCLGWLDRHPLTNHGRESMIVWDSGQFHHRDGKVLAVLDLELAHIGDPLMDLAAFRMRDTIVGYGDFTRLYERYGELVGEPVDLDAVEHHHIAFTLSNQLAFHAALADPPPGSDYMTNLQWCCETNLFAVEALADRLEIELEPVALPETEVSPGAVAHAHLVGALRNLPVADEFAAYERRAAFRLARHLQRSDELGRAVAAADLDDLAALLGRRPSTWQEGDAELEQFVLADAGRHDEELVVLFHRRLWRAHQLLGPAGSAMTRHHPIQRFR
jgi:aminoglycoside phosphotransferase (APT) family kinase protein